MPITQAELGRRLRATREASGLTQEEVAEALGVSRPTVAQIELGNRAVTSLELDRLAYLYARDIREFLAASFAEDDPVHALFRSQTDTGGDVVKQALRDCLSLGRELTSLQELLGLTRAVTSAPAYAVARPGSKWDAIQSGALAAGEERRRLGLGSAPVGDVVELLEAEGVRSGMISMPDEISGLTIARPDVGLFIVVNGEHAPVRQRFSFCHEYAHVLLDRGAGGLVSRTTERDDLIEVRANAFAANFLMPEEGVRRFVANIGKGASSRFQADIFDEAGVSQVNARADPRSQDLQLYEVVPMAHHFGVSVLSALYRLRNLKLLTEAEFERLKEQDEAGQSRQVADILGLPEPVRAHHEFMRRFVGLALEAYRRDRITKAKLIELAAGVGVGADAVERLLLSSGLADNDPETPLLPQR